MGWRLSSRIKWAWLLIFWASTALAQTTVYDGLTLPTTTTHPILLGLNNSTQYSNAQTWLTNNPFTPGTCDDYHPKYCNGIALKHTLNGANDCSAAITWGLGLANNATSSGAASCGGQGADNSINSCSEALVYVYDMCYDQMNSTQRSQYLAGGNVWFGNYNSGTGNGTIGYGCPLGLLNNHCWGHERAAFMWGVATFAENNTNAEANLDEWSGQWTNFKTLAASSTVGSTGAGYGGVTQEGLNYGKLVTMDFVPILNSAQWLGRDLMAETAFFQWVPYSLIYGLLPAQTYSSPGATTCWEFFPWNEGHLLCDATDFLNNSSEVTNTSDLMAVIATYYSGTNTGGYSKTWLNSVAATQMPLDTWVASLTAVPSSATPYTSLPLDFYAPGAGFFWGRKAWDTSSAITHWQLNTPSAVGHITAVAGTWQMWRGGYWLSRTTAGYSQNFTGYNSTGYIPNTASGVQNGILVNPDNQGCTPGSTCQGDGGEYILASVPSYPPASPAQTSRLESQSGYAYAAVDISGSYCRVTCASHPANSNPAVNTIVREFVWVRDLETLVVFDRILANDVGSTTAGNIKRTFLAHCEVAWSLTGANTATCNPGTGQNLYLTTLLPGTPNPSYHVTNEQTYASNANGQYRLEVNDTPGTAQSYFLHVLTPSATLSPSVSNSGGNYIVTLDGSHSITFVQGSTSSGGSITLSGTTTNFTSSVEQLNVTSAGVTWGNSGIFAGFSGPAGITGKAGVN